MNVHVGAENLPHDAEQPLVPREPGEQFADAVYRENRAGLAAHRLSDRQFGLAYALGCPELIQFVLQYLKLSRVEETIEVDESVSLLSGDLIRRQRPRMCALFRMDNGISTSQNLTRAVDTRRVFVR